MDTIVMIQIALELWGAFFTLICAVASYLGRRDEPQRSTLLTLILLTITTLLISDSVAYIFRGIPTVQGFMATRISNFLVFLTAPLLFSEMILFMRELVRTRGGELSVRWQQIVFFFSILDISVIIASQFTDFIYYFDENNVYHRAGGYVFIALISFLMLVILGWLIFRHRTFMSKYETIALLLYVFLPLLTNIIQLFHYGLSLNNIAITISFLLLFLNHQIEKSGQLADQRELLMKTEIHIAHQNLQLAQKDTELTQRRIQISISQMQPHFIFNALGSIEQLCRTMPDRAADATHYFAIYLRNNLNALSSQDLVAFHEELEHIRAYCWLETMRFGDDLNYQEDIKADNFHLPALSIQPLVENCIKHGLMGKEEGSIHVVLSTREEPDAYLIVIADDGCGFDVDHLPQDGRTHVGMSNVKDRIAMMCGGTVEVSSVIGQGTTVTVRLPKSGQHSSLLQ